LVPLVDEYRSILAEYIQKRDRPGILALPFRKNIVQRHNVERTVARLNALDTRRQVIANPNAPRSAPAALAEASEAFGAVPPPSVPPR